MRDNWDVYFMKIAHQVATRGTCDRAHVGTIIVRDRNILATGYNGSIIGTEHCDDAGHLIRDDHCIRTAHAEVNAIAQAAKNGIAIKDASLYITHFCCWNCFKMVVNAGIRNIYFDNLYRLDPAIEDMICSKTMDGDNLSYGLIPLCSNQQRVLFKQHAHYTPLIPVDKVTIRRIKVEEKDQKKAND